MSGILGELRGGDQTNEVDYTLEIRCTGFGEVPTQMLPAQANCCGKLFGRHGSAGVGDDHVPRRALEWGRQAESRRRFAEGVSKPRREGVGMHQIADGVLIYPFNYEINEAEPGAAGCGR